MSSHHLAIPSIEEPSPAVAALLSAYMDSRGAILGVIDALSVATPYSLDYDPQGVGALRIAEDGHSVCWRALNALATELLWLGNPELREGDDSEMEDLLAEIPLRPASLPLVNPKGTEALTLYKAAFEVYRRCSNGSVRMKLTAPTRETFASLRQRALATIQHDERMTLLRRVGNYFLLVAQSVASQANIAPEEMVTAVGG